MKTITKLLITTPLITTYQIYIDIWYINVTLLCCWFIWCLVPNKYFYIEAWKLRKDETKSLRSKNKNDVWSDIKEKVTKNEILGNKDSVFIKDSKEELK